MLDFAGYECQSMKRLVVYNTVACGLQGIIISGLSPNCPRMSYYPSALISIVVWRQSIKPINHTFVNCSVIIFQLHTCLAKALQFSNIANVVLRLETKIIKQPLLNLRHNDKK